MAITISERIKLASKTLRAPSAQRELHLRVMGRYGNISDIDLLPHYYDGFKRGHFVPY